MSDGNPIAGRGGDDMSAELLRQAATILRERAEAVDNCEGWRNYYEDAELVMHPAAGRDDAQFIALMHPGVGLALADWLDAAGADFFAWGGNHFDPAHEPCIYCDDDVLAPHLRRAVGLARLIVGGAS